MTTTMTTPLTTNDLSTIASRCLAIRTTTGLSIRAFSNFISISNSLWVELEAGKREPGGAVLRGLMARGFSADWLLAGVGTMLLGQPANLDETTHFKTMQLVADLNLAELAAGASLSHFESHERIRLCLHQNPGGLTFAELQVETGFDARLLRGFLSRMVEEAILRQEKGRYKVVDSHCQRLVITEVKTALMEVFHFFGKVLVKRLCHGEPDSRMMCIQLNAVKGQEAETVQSLAAQIKSIVGSLAASESVPSTPIRIIFASSAEAR